MKKLLIAGMTTLLLLGSAVVTEQAEAAPKKVVKVPKYSSNINYYSKTTAKNILNGNLTIDGFGIGKSFLPYLNSENYEESREGNLVKSTGYSAVAIADFQNHLDYEKRKVSRILIDRINHDKKFSRNKMKAIYGKPLYSYSKRQSGREFIDVYKNVTFMYSAYGNKTELNSAVFFKNPSKDYLYSWRDRLNKGRYGEGYFYKPAMEKE